MRYSCALLFRHLLCFLASPHTRCFLLPRRSPLFAFHARHGHSVSSIMKRKATDSQSTPKAKRSKEPLADYCDVEVRKDEEGNPIWPALPEAIENARSFLREW